MGVVAPSSGVASLTPRRFKRAVDQLEGLGLRVVVSDHAYSRSARYPHLSAPAEERASSLNGFLRDPEIRGIFCTIGGHSAIDLLGRVDFDAMRVDPKVFVGFSDVCVLHMGFFTQADVVTFTGPSLLPQFGDYGGISEVTKESLYRTVFSRDPVGLLRPADHWFVEWPRWDVEDDRPRVQVPSKGPVPLREGEAFGQIVPTNLESLMCLSGTKYFPELSDKILMIESSEQTSTAEYLQCIAHLALLGVFEQISGLVLGRFHPASCIKTANVWSLMDPLVPPSVPVLGEIDFGHTDPMWTLPWGIRARLKVSQGKGEICLLESAVI